MNLPAKSWHTQNILWPTSAWNYKHTWRVRKITRKTKCSVYKTKINKVRIGKISVYIVIVI